jgi:hypothetical protein
VRWLDHLLPVRLEALDGVARRGIRVRHVELVARREVLRERRVVVVLLRLGEREGQRDEPQFEYFETVPSTQPAFQLSSFNHSLTCSCEGGPPLGVHLAERAPASRQETSSPTSISQGRSPSFASSSNAAKKSASQSSAPCENDESRHTLDGCAPTGHLYLARTPDISTLLRHDAGASAVPNGGRAPAG